MNKKYIEISLTELCLALQRLGVGFIKKKQRNKNILEDIFGYLFLCFINPIPGRRGVREGEVGGSWEEGGPGGEGGGVPRGKNTFTVCTPALLPFKLIEKVKYL